MKAQKQKRINLYSVKGAWRFDQSIQSKIIALAFSMAPEIERDLISQCTKETLRFKKAQGMKLGRPTAPAKRKLDPYRPEIENLLANGSTQSLSLVATTQPRPIFTKHGLKLSKDLVLVLTSPKGIRADVLNIR
jgi:DNA invertase Pin-like site-specific DNA recombinase